jgi:hypothetical protein
LFFSFLPFVIITFNELKEKNSTGACVLAVWTILCIFLTLGEGTYHIIKLRKRSLQIHNNAAYLLYSTNDVLNRWGFLFTPYKASHCWFLAPTLVYFLLKGAFIGASQNNSTVLAVAIAVLDVLYFVATAVYRPYLDKSINSMNLAVCVMNVLNAGLLLEFSDIFTKPVCNPVAYLKHHY